MLIETIRLSQKEKDQLTTIKRNTGIDQWNILCRWAFCLSLAEPSPPPRMRITSDSNVEMSWKVFGGDAANVYKYLLINKAKKTNINIHNQQSLYNFFRHHLNRGIGHLNFETSKTGDKNSSNFFQHLILHSLA